MKMERWKTGTKAGLRLSGSRLSEFYLRDVFSWSIAKWKMDFVVIVMLKVNHILKT
jgi:hypothetical protein